MSLGSIANSASPAACRPYRRGVAIGSRPGALLSTSSRDTKVSEGMR